MVVNAEVLFTSLECLFAEYDSLQVAGGRTVLVDIEHAVLLLKEFEEKVQTTIVLRLR